MESGFSGLWGGGGFFLGQCRDIWDINFQLIPSPSFYLLATMGYIHCTLHSLIYISSSWISITKLAGTLYILLYPSPCRTLGTLMDFSFSDILISHLLLMTWALKETVRPMSNISFLLSTNSSSLLWASFWDGCHGSWMRVLPRQDQHSAAFFLAHSVNWAQIWIKLDI